jgi:hypothetical protein
MSSLHKYLSATIVGSIICAMTAPVLAAECTRCTSRYPIISQAVNGGGGEKGKTDLQIVTTFIGHVVSSTSSSIQVCEGTTANYSLGGTGPVPTYAVVDGIVSMPNGLINIENYNHKLLADNRQIGGGDFDNITISPYCPADPCALIVAEGPLLGLQYGTETKRDNQQLQMEFIGNIDESLTTANSITVCANTQLDYKVSGNGPFGEFVLMRDGVYVAPEGHLITNTGVVIKFTADNRTVTGGKDLDVFYVYVK